VQGVGAAWNSLMVASFLLVLVIAASILALQDLVFEFRWFPHLHLLQLDIGTILYFRRALRISTSLHSFTLYAISFSIYQWGLHDEILVIHFIFFKTRCGSNYRRVQRRVLQLVDPGHVELNGPSANNILEYTLLVSDFLQLSVQVAISFLIVHCPVLTRNGLRTDHQPLNKIGVLQSMDC
jgi:hypothetical protein